MSAMSEFIGVIRDAATGDILAIINPDDDAQLDNPRLLQIRRAEGPSVNEMIKVPRGEYTRAMTADQLIALVERLRE